MSIDAMRIQEATGHLWMVWSSPLQIVIALALVGNLLGISVLAGVAVMVILVPLNAFLASQTRKLQVWYQLFICFLMKLQCIFEFDYFLIISMVAYSLQEGDLPSGHSLQ